MMHQNNLKRSSKLFNKTLKSEFFLAKQQAIKSRFSFNIFQHDVHSGFICAIITSKEK